MTHDFAPTATNEIEGAPRDDNARKFLLDGLTPEFLLHVGAKRFDLVIDFIEFGVDREVKLVHKTAEDGTVKMLRTTKVVVDGLRTSDPVVLSEDAYKAELNRSVRKVVKRQY